MLGSSSNEGSRKLDTFTCLKCETVITTAPPPSGLDRSR